MGGYQSSLDNINGYGKTPRLAIINLIGQCYGILSLNIKHECLCGKPECPMDKDCNIISIILTFDNNTSYKFPIKISRLESNIYIATISTLDAS